MFENSMLLTTLVLLVATVYSVEVIVGDDPERGNIGWKEGSYCYLPIENVRPDDVITFKFAVPFHNVYQMSSEEAMENCDFTDAVRLSDRSPYSYTVSPADFEDNATALYFACGKGWHCEAEQRIKVILDTSGNTEDRSIENLPVSIIEPGSDFGSCTAGRVTSLNCVSGQVTVSGRNKDVKVQDLNIGDEILGFLDGQHHVYQKVYSFGHYNSYAVGSFIAMETHENLTNISPLEISAEHLLFKNDGADTIPVRSDDVQIGDHVLTHDGKKALVEKLSQVERPGLFSPLVSQGVFVASGTVISSYTAAARHSGDHQSSLKIGTSYFLSHHMLSHVALSPLRVLCQGGYKKPCNQRNSEGQLLFAYTGQQLLSFLHITLVCTIFLSILPLFLLEQLWTNTGVDSFCMVICILALLVVVFLHPRSLK